MFGQKAVIPVDLELATEDASDLLMISAEQQQGNQQIFW